VALIAVLDEHRPDLLFKELDAGGIIQRAGIAGLEENSGQRRGKKKVQARCSPGAGSSCKRG